MIREEAINLLYGMRSDNLNFDDAYTKDKYDALDMAIKALEQESKTDTWSIKDVVDTFKKHGLIREQETVLDKIRTEIADLDDADYDYEGYYKAVTDAVNIIDKYRTESETKE